MSHGYKIDAGLINEHGYRNDIVLDRGAICDLVVRDFREGSDVMGNIGTPDAEPEAERLKRGGLGSSLLCILKHVWWTLGMHPLAWHHPRFHELDAMVRGILDELVAAGAVVATPFSYPSDHPHGATAYAPGPKLSAQFCWISGVLPDLDGMARFTYMIMAEGDPERTPREARGSFAERDTLALWRKKLVKDDVESWCEAISAHLASDGAPRSFNRIMVEMIDKTAADVGDTAPWEALWRLLWRGRIALTTNTSPPLFRHVLGPPPAPRSLPPGEFDDLDFAINACFPKDAGIPVRIKLETLAEMAADEQRVGRKCGSWTKAEAIYRIWERISTGSLERSEEDDPGLGLEVWLPTDKDIARRTANVTDAPDMRICAPADDRDTKPANRDPKPGKGRARRGNVSASEQDGPAPDDVAATAPAERKRGGGWSSSKNPVKCLACGEEWPRDPALEVECPACKAKVGVWCKSPSGHKAMQLHAGRIERAFAEGHEHRCPGALVVGEDRFRRVATAGVYELVAEEPSGTMRLRSGRVVQRGVAVWQLFDPAIWVRLHRLAPDGACALCGVEVADRSEPCPGPRRGSRSGEDRHDPERIAAPEAAVASPPVDDVEPRPTSSAPPKAPGARRRARERRWMPSRGAP